LKVIVCGGRNYDNKARVFDALDSFHRVHGISLLTHGDALGADRLADEWARVRGIDRVAFPANWTGRGRPAGHYRNRLMLLTMKPAWVIAFPGGAGTAGMIDIAVKAGAQVIRFNDDPSWWDLVTSVSEHA
jgi:hypothetical protein